MIIGVTVIVACEFSVSCCAYAKGMKHNRTGLIGGKKTGAGPAVLIAIWFGVLYPHLNFAVCIDRYVSCLFDGMATGIVMASWSSLAWSITCILPLSRRKLIDSDRVL